MSDAGRKALSSRPGVRCIRRLRELGERTLSLKTEWGEALDSAKVSRSIRSRPQEDGALDTTFAYVAGQTRSVRLVACAMCGALMATATPPMNVYPMAWLGMVPLAWMLDDLPARASNASKLRLAMRGGLHGFVFGLGTNIVALRFIAPVVARFTPLPAWTGALALLALAAFEATRWVCAAVLYGWLVRGGVPRPVAFAIGVFGGTFVPTMIPWTVACGVCPWPATVQLAELFGERGVALLMALEAALVASGVKHMSLHANRSAARALGLAATLVGSTLVYGAIRIRQIDVQRVASANATVALVEPAVEASLRWDESRAHDILARLTELTLRAESDGVDLVIWPEAAYPFHMEHVSRHSPTGEQAILQPGVRGPVLTGLIMTGGLGKYNSTVVATRDGMVSEPYDKVHLMWFGEAVPFGDRIPWLRETFSRGRGLRAGERGVPLEAGPVRAAVLNCLEDILPEAGREAMRLSPNLLVNVTNDAWFEDSAESEYHLLLARLRSVELRRDLVRAVNFGPTTWVDAAGRVLARIPPDRPGVLKVRPALLAGPPTAYARWGDLPLALVTGAYAMIRAARRKS
jgi:apolipoprotein N-acyltransferase